MENERLHAAPMSQKTLFFKLFSFSWLKKKVWIEFIAHLFIILFLYTGISKLLELVVFQEQLAVSPIFGKIAPIMGYAVPLTEFIISLMLFFPRHRLKGFYSTLILMVLFTVYVITLFTISPELPCSCGGIIEDLTWTGHLIFNCSLILLSIIGIRLQRAAQLSISSIQEKQL